MIAGSLKIESKDSPVAAEDLDKFERRWELQLPSSYRSFLMKCNGGQPTPCFLPIGKNEPGFDCIEIDSIYGLHRKLRSSDINHIYETLSSNVPRGILPIASVPWEGRELVLDLRDGGEEVKFWDSAKFWGNNVWKEDYLYPVAKDFATLLTMFVTEDEAMDQSMQPLSEFLD